MKIWGGAVLALAAGAALAGEGAYSSLEAWGEALFFDVNLSANRTQACATCHSPDFGFVDPRQTAAGRAVSLGDDGASLGDRNAPTASYARFVPPFGLTPEGTYRGGLFHDGRAATLADQAGGPPLNPVEMGMTDKAAVLARLTEDARHAASLAAFGGSTTDPEAAYAAMTRAIAAYETTEDFAPFTSKYDRYLRGEVELTDQEELGRVLFFSSQFTNCNICHQLRAAPVAADETFSNYEYHNIGTPPNRAARAVNGVAPGHVDRGLLDNPAVTDPAQSGKFRVPTLRNVAVTGPYMHNGVFDDLRTVILFYNKYNSRLPHRQINPETGQGWAAPEVAENLSLTELETGPALDDQRIDALVAFLETLTDARYEPLLTDR
ncbi:methylamine utilization protein MauG [Rhodobacter veldkampii DSM 11550]|uniref:Methylamine utilization protein MauG n=1 Tax=Phaeovulum veldkampii DSM 11550 TaxID=1185920 RepID=A0A2T4JEA5_9RHOB|nr:cytochrome c peroxidase [Phaeovulum veldkampii]MBK5945202.1 methylamine utilization protein MauG [Phaeovulum veldkampii DSM 11550]PTE16245.1 methylamine utilization protein MauG [Phaeovulum veldkampii DSM 11550]TDQ58241.1 cytochrome c peroxidase [Phaeovulum veldkampii DSM 11550]